MTQSTKDGVTTTYTYNGDGLRMSKTTNGVTTSFILDGADVVAEIKGNEITVYSRGLGLVSQTKGDTTKTYFSDDHGNVTGMYSSATDGEEALYDGFGNTLFNDSTDNPFGYCGEYYDEETGLIYLRARYYDPEIGRFISEDPVMDGTNWYVYCYSNHIRYKDPSGCVITCDEAYSERIISLLREVSGNSLEFEYKDGQINITKTYDTDHHVGQTLVSDLINSSEMVNVNIGMDSNGDTNSKFPASMDANGTIQIYIDPDDSLGNGKPYTYVQNDNGDVIEEEFPQFILFGHELIHAWREIHGLFDGNVERGVIPYDNGILLLAEEIKTMGINYTDAFGNQMQNYDTYDGIISENGLRMENGFNLRVSYRGVWKK